MNIVFIVVVSLAIPLLCITAFTDRQSFNQAIKIREMISEILLSLAEWENGKSTVFKLLTLKSYLRKSGEPFAANSRIYVHSSGRQAASEKERADCERRSPAILRMCVG
jgi:hypothetical protein